MHNSRPLRGLTPNLFYSNVESASQKSSQRRAFAVPHPRGNFIDALAAGFQQMNRVFHP